jgi:hypothetical protein
MAAFLSSLGASLGMNGPGGIAGGLGTLIGQSLTTPGQPMSQNNPGTTIVGQSQYTDPFKPVGNVPSQASPPAPSLGVPQTMAGPNKAYDNWLLQNAQGPGPQGSTPVNTGYASGYTYNQ